MACDMWCVLFGVLCVLFNVTSMYGVRCVVWCVVLHVSAVYGMWCVVFVVWRVVCVVTCSSSTWRVFCGVCCLVLHVAAVRSLCLVHLLLPCIAILIVHYFMEFTINYVFEKKPQCKVTETFGVITVDFFVEGYFPLGCLTHMFLKR